MTCVEMPPLVVVGAAVPPLVVVGAAVPSIPSRMVLKPDCCGPFGLDPPNKDIPASKLLKLADTEVAE